MEGQANSLETPDAFLTALGESLGDKEGVDEGLAKILKVHILKVSPAQDAVTQAKNAILKLATERAESPKVEVVDG